MEKTKVVIITGEGIQFENGVVLLSEHTQDCCESHSLSFDDLTMEDFEGLEFDLTGDSFFKRIDGYGIELIPISGHSVKIPGYGYNNGYYGTDLLLVLMYKGNIFNTFDISECQAIEDN